MKLIDKLKEIGIPNIDDLPAKTQLKIKEYVKIVNTGKKGIYWDKKADDWKPNVKIKLKGLQEDILTEAYMHLEDLKKKKAEEEGQEGTSEQENKKGTDTSQASAEEKKGEDKKTTEGEKKPQEASATAAAADDTKKERSSWTDWIWPF